MAFEIDRRTSRVTCNAGKLPPGGGDMPPPGVHMQSAA